jgi:hypothetical protein
MTTLIYFYGKHEMLKTENPIIFTFFGSKSYFSCFTFKNNKRVLFSASAKGREICVDASMCIIFWYFLLLCVRILIRSEGAEIATFIWYTIIGQHQHQQPTYQQPTHLQQNFVLRKP